MTDAEGFSSDEEKCFATTADQDMFDHHGNHDCLTWFWTLAIYST